ncbi:MAG TPA: class II D-tagatose-bisphosphate aldolase, non-catalytic subunit, partial [Thermoclostridium caenicola]|nr:class II D-tagatose-bisphosphate aldolase, non-catalytic subunit [Thermoclostridium caenicola]
MKTVTFFNNLIREQKSGRDTAVCSVCSANEFVLEAAMEDGKESGRPVLIEATANQVNQFGGYSGMKPKDFVSFVKNIARSLDFPEESLILGGDHLG